MAKYVGKIFQVANRHLGIKKQGCHYVHVTWYNPFSRKFRCKVITSLEDKHVLSKTERKILGTTPFYLSDRTYYLFRKKLYPDIREGNITPIPVPKTEGFEG